MAKSKLNYWLGEGRDKLIKIASIARTDNEIYKAMGINKATYYRYRDNSDFCDLIKNAREGQIEDNTERLKQLHEDMWKQAHEQTFTETFQELVADPKTGELKPKSGRKITKTLPGDTTLQIYLDKTYGTNINSQEIIARTELSKVRADVQRLVLNPDIDEATKSKLDAVRKILGGVESVIGKAE